MIIEKENYLWKKWVQPIFKDNKTWGEVSSSSIHDTSSITYEPYLALDNDPNTNYEGDYGIKNADYKWVFEKPLKIFNIELTNRIGTDIDLTKRVEIYADNEKTQLISEGEFELVSGGKCNIKLDKSISCDMIIISLISEIESKYVGISELNIIAEVGEAKNILDPLFNTNEDMTLINGLFNDDGVFNVSVNFDFAFNGSNINVLYISSNSYFGFGENREHIKICRRDGCSTSIYKQYGQVLDLEFLKIRFEGYSVYNSRIEENRIVYELFIMSNNDMFLNIIKIPSSNYKGVSQIVCNDVTTELNVEDSIESNISLYNKDKQGLKWNIFNKSYEYDSGSTTYFLLKVNEKYYSIKDDEYTEVEIYSLSPLNFVKYGFDNILYLEDLETKVNPEILSWVSSSENIGITANIKAYPIPQILEIIIEDDESILGIKGITSEFSGSVGIVKSNDGMIFEEEIPLVEFLKTNLEELFQNLRSFQKIILRFILHEDATIKNFIIEYIN